MTRPIPLPGRCKRCGARLVLLDNQWRNENGTDHECEDMAG